MLQVHRISAFTDNYFWLIQPDSQSSDCYTVDPGAAQPVCDYLDAYKLQLKGILITHHHPDHIGGVGELRGLFQIPIYGPKSAKIPQVTHYLKEGDYLKLGPLSAKVVEIPGHTLDHIAYLIEEPKDAPLLFSGDTIFAAGCGRLFDGTAQLLYAAFQKISQLPDATQIYAAHEYTLANIEFALTIEPDNHDLRERKIKETTKREQGLATLPTSLILEKRTNPFLRCHLNSVRRSVEQKIGKQLAEDGEIFASLRLIKDRF